MDMLKKARGKAMAAVKEVQTIVQERQQTTAQPSYQQNPYQPHAQYTTNQFSSHQPSYPPQQVPANYGHTSQYIPPSHPGQFQHQVPPSSQYPQNYQNPQAHQPQKIAPPLPPRPQYHAQSQSFPPPAASAPPNSYMTASNQNYPNPHSPPPQPTTAYSPYPAPQLSPPPQQLYAIPAAAPHQTMMATSPSPDQIYAPRPTSHQPPAGQQIASPVYPNTNITPPNFTPAIQNTVNQPIHYAPPIPQNQAPLIQTPTHPIPYSPPQNPLNTHTPPLQGNAGQPPPYIPPSSAQIHTPTVQSSVHHSASPPPNPIQTPASPVQSPAGQPQWASSNPPQPYPLHAQNVPIPPAYSPPISTQSYAPPAQAYSPSAPSYTPPVQSHAPAAQSYSPPAQTHTPLAHSHAPAAQSYSPPAQTHTPLTQNHAPPAPSYSPPAQSYAPPPQAYYPPTQIHTSLAQIHAPPAQNNTPYQAPPQPPQPISPDITQSQTPPVQDFTQQSAYPAPLKLSHKNSDAQVAQSQPVPPQMSLPTAATDQQSSVQAQIRAHSPLSLPDSKPTSTTHSYSIPEPQTRTYTNPVPDTEQPGLIPVELEAPYEPHLLQPVLANTFKPTPARARQKCSGFNGVLTDIVPFYELKAAVVKTHNIPVNPGGVLAICEFCFLDIIAPHPWLANCFDQRAPDGRPDNKSLPQISFEKMIGCGLAFPAIRQVIIGQAIPRLSVQPFLDYAKLDAQLPPCTGTPTTGDYYGSHSIEEIALCRTCFECYIRGTSFEGHFSLIQMTQPHQPWVCDVGYEGYIQRVLLADLPSNNFSHFASEAKKKLSMPPCAGEGKSIALAGPNSSSCFRSVEDNRGVFCSNCFYDCVVGLPAEKSFGYEIELGGNAQRASLACDLAAGVSKYFMSLAVAAGQYDVWHGPIMAKSVLPLCPSIAGKDEADLMTENPPQAWYYFIEHPTIEVCPRCYGMNVCSLQAEELFAPITRPLKAEVIRQCYLSPVKEFSYSMDPMDYENTTAWRGNFLRNAIIYGRDAGGDFTVARQVASIIASYPPACGSELRKFKKGSGRKFLGHQALNPHDLNDATLIVCEECFAYSVKGTQMESFFNNDLTHLTWSEPEGHRCSTWSKQCKRRLRTACETGDFASYAQWHHQREDVYNRLWAVINELKPMNAELQNHTRRVNEETQMTIQMGSMKLAQQMNAQTNAVMMGIGGSMAEASASDTGSRYGNSTVGMGYLTSSGANAAQAQHDAANVPAVNFQPNWKNVPLEQLTVEFKKKMALQEELRKQWAVLD